MKKANTLPKLLILMLKVLFWLLLLGSLFYGLFTLRACYGLLTTEDTGQLFVSGISLDYIRFYSDSGGIAISREAMLKMNGISLIVYFFQVPMLCYGIHLLEKILNPIAQGCPFSGTAKVLQKLGWISLGVAVIQNLTKWSMIHVSEYHYMLSELFLGSVITDVSFRFKPDMTFLVSAAIFFLLAQVFVWGEELQQLSDETL